MGIQQSIQGNFSSLPPFTDALEAGVKDEINQALVPIQQELADLKNQIATLSAATADAQAAASAAQTTANTALTTAQTSTTGSTATTTGTTTGTTTTSTSPTGSSSTSPRQTVFVTAISDPLIIGSTELFNFGPNNLRAPADVSVTPREDALYVGSQAELRYRNIDPTVRFTGWVNSDTNQLLSTANPFVLTLPDVQSLNIVAKFIPR
jgi:hypothetical protein